MQLILYINGNILALTQVGFLQAHVEFLNCTTSISLISSSLQSVENFGHRPTHEISFNPLHVHLLEQSFVIKSTPFAYSFPSR